MRIFIAVNLPKNVKDYLYELQKQVGNDYAKIKWMAKKNFHITLKFIGEINKETVDEIKEKLREIKYGKCNVTLDEIKWFPNRKTIRVLWLGLKPEKNIMDLQKLVDGKLVNLLGESQIFTAHLTLGRVKLLKNVDKFIERLKSLEIKPIEFSIESFELMKSKLSKDGSNYRVIESYDLV